MPRRPRAIARAIAPRADGHPRPGVPERLRPVAPERPRLDVPGVPPTSALGRPRRGAAARRLGAAVLGMAAGAAQAHGSATGMAGFAEGFVHPLLEPAHLVALMVLALLIGQQGHGPARWAPAGLALGAGIGLLVAAFGWPVGTEVPLLACAAIAGLAVTVGRRLPMPVYLVLAALMGAGIGLGSLPEGPRGAAMAATMFGTWAGSWTWLVIASHALAGLTRPWTRVLIRVAASWMAACALLFLALSIAPRTMPPVGAPGTLDVGR